MAATTMQRKPTSTLPPAKRKRISEYGLPCYDERVHRRPNLKKHSA